MRAGQVTRSVFHFSGIILVRNALKFKNDMLKIKYIKKTCTEPLQLGGLFPALHVSLMTVCLSYG